MTYVTAALSLALLLAAGTAIAAGQTAGGVPIDGLSADQLDALASVLGGANR